MGAFPRPEKWCSTPSHSAALYTILGDVHTPAALVGPPILAGGVGCSRGGSSVTRCVRPGGGLCGRGWRLHGGSAKALLECGDVEPHPGIWHQGIPLCPQRQRMLHSKVPCLSTVGTTWYFHTKHIDIV